MLVYAVGSVEAASVRLLPGVPCSSFLHWKQGLRKGGHCYVRARRVDSNLSELVKAARKMGFRINVRNDDLADVDAQLPGCDKTEIWEVKVLKGARFTERQKKRREEGWLIMTVRTVDDLLLARERMRG